MSHDIRVFIRGFIKSDKQKKRKSLKAESGNAPPTKSKVLFQGQI